MQGRCLPVLAVKATQAYRCIWYMHVVLCLCCWQPLNILQNLETYMLQGDLAVKLACQGGCFGSPLAQNRIPAAVSNCNVSACLLSITDLSNKVATQRHLCTTPFPSLAQEST